MSKWIQTRSSDCLVCPAVMLGTHQMWKIVVCLDDCVWAPTDSPISFIIFQNPSWDRTWVTKNFLIKCKLTSTQPAVQEVFSSLKEQQQKQKKNHYSNSYVVFGVCLSPILCVWSRFYVRMSLHSKHELLYLLQSVLKVIQKVFV